MRPSKCRGNVRRHEYFLFTSAILKMRHPSSHRTSLGDYVCTIIQVRLAYFISISRITQQNGPEVLIKCEMNIRVESQTVMSVSTLAQ
jgi:hypothetical protein